MSSVIAMLLPSERNLLAMIGADGTEEAIGVMLKSFQWNVMPGVSDTDGSSVTFALTDNLSEVRKRYSHVGQEICS
jgi:hypothetical protein